MGIVVHNHDPARLATLGGQAASPSGNLGRQVAFGAKPQEFPISHEFSTGTVDGFTPQKSAVHLAPPHNDVGESAVDKSVTQWKRRGMSSRRRKSRTAASRAFARTSSASTLVD